VVIRDRKKEKRRSADIVVLVFPTDATFFVVGKIEIILFLFYGEKRAACSRAEREKENESSSSSSSRPFFSSFFARERGREREREWERRSEFLEKTLDLFPD
jgi:hypothetical protein